jgi:FdhD protein
MNDISQINDQIRHLEFMSYGNGRLQQMDGSLAVEAPLEILVNDRRYTTLMQTPGCEKSLVPGFLYTDGLIDTITDVSSLAFEPGPSVMGINGMKAFVHIPGQALRREFPQRPAVALTSSGAMDTKELQRLARELTRIDSTQVFRWETLPPLLEDLEQHQQLYALTRGTHAVALYDARGTFLHCFEDVGRHNALDKIIGHCLLQGIPFHDKLVVLSGRASLEMVLKTARAGLPLLLCFSSPTVMAVQAAHELNLTLVGRQEDHSLAGLTHTERLTT